MLHSLKLLLPALLPSWRFFDYIAPSPRIEYALFDTGLHIVSDWREFKPRPAHLSVGIMLQRLVWNPDWNESLFMMSCAERIINQYTQQTEHEITSRIVVALQVTQSQLCADARYLQFRLQFIARSGEKLQQQACFTSKQVALPARVAA